MKSTFSRIRSAFIISLLVALVWSVLQFALVEGSYRLSKWPDLADKSESLMSASDTLAWPAGDWYDEMQYGIYRDELERLQSQSTLSPEETKDVPALIAAIPEDSTPLDVETEARVFEILGGHGVDATVPAIREYLYYGGACLLWGFGIAAFGFLVATGLILSGENREGH